MALPDSGDVGIIGSGVTAVVTTTGGLAGWVNENALVLGLILSVISLLIGVCFKFISARRSERHHAERLELEKRENEQTRSALLIEVRKMFS